MTLILQKSFFPSEKKIQFKFSLINYCLLLLFFFSGQVNSQSISNITVNPTTVCAGQTVTLTFTATNGNGRPKAVY